MGVRAGFGPGLARGGRGCREQILSARSDQDRLDPVGLFETIAVYRHQDFTLGNTALVKLGLRHPDASELVGEPATGSLGSGFQHRSELARCQAAAQSAARGGNHTIKLVQQLAK